MVHEHSEYVVIGLGRFGTSLALTLIRNGHTVLGIDKDPEIVQSLAEKLTHVLCLDSTNEEVLLSAGVDHFDTVVVAIGTDFENNLLTTVALKNIGIRRVVCKALTEKQKLILTKVGADMVVLPEMEAGHRLAHDLMLPELQNRIPLKPEYSIAEVNLPESLHGQTLRQANLRGKYGITVLVVERGEQLTVSPGADFRLETGDYLVMLSSVSGLEEFLELN